LLDDVNIDTLRGFASMIEAGVDRSIDRMFTKIAVAVSPDVFKGEDKPFWEAGGIWSTRKGIAASNIWEAGGLIRGNPNVSYPNLQYHFGPVGFEYEGDKIGLLQAFALHVDQLRPRSRGSVTLKSASPDDKPLMHFNYLADPHDLSELVEGVHKARELVNQSAFDELRGAEMDPGPDIKSDKQISDWIRNVTITDFHPSGTCRMGQGDDAVVDAEMRVHGIEGLRVVDASVMPQIISANLNAPTQMIASRAADYILGKTQLQPFETRFSFQ
jgi:choline dehydrogenase